jgi:hypothetical protein
LVAPGRAIGDGALLTEAPLEAFNRKPKDLRDLWPYLPASDPSQPKTLSHESWCREKCRDYLHTWSVTEYLDLVKEPVIISLWHSVIFSEQWPKRSAKPLFIGSIPIAASNLFNNLEPFHSLVKRLL